MDKISCVICGKENVNVHIEKDGFSYVKCADCSLVYLNPQPQNDELSGYYNQKYNVDKRRYLGRKRKWIEIIKIIKTLKKSGNLLEIGSSFGLFLKIANENGFKAKGVEISGEACEFAKNNFKVDIFPGELRENQELFKEKFDIACLWHVIEHLKNPSEIIEMISKLLSREGYLVFTTPNINSIPAKKLGKYWEWINPPKHLFLFNIYSIKKLLEKNKFEVVDIFTRQGDYTAYLSSLFALPFKKNDKSKKNSKIKSKKILEFKRYWNLKIKSILSLDFLFKFIFLKDENGPEIFVIAKKSGS